MWKPDVVVPEHRWRARIIWGSLLLSISAYTIWQVWNIFHKLQHPSTSLEVTDDLYQFPFVMVCFFDGHGCGMADTSTSFCLSTALEFSTVYFDGEDLTDIVVTTEASNCLGFDLRELDVAESEYGKESDVLIDMQWVQSDMGSGEEDFFTNIAVLMADEPPPVGTYSFLNVPYSRNLVGMDEVFFQQTDLTIGKTTKKNLDGDTTTNYPALIMSTSNYNSSLTYEDEEGDMAYGRLYLRITQGSYSLSAVEEISPLDIGTFLGNVGGFWELLIILWGLFFITIQQQEPELKARDFGKSLRTGAEIITRRRSLSVGDASSTSQTEERPPWEAAYRGGNPNHVTAATVAAGPFLGSGGTHGGVAAALGIPAIPPTNGGTNGDSVGTRRASNASSNGSISNDYYRPADVSNSSHRRPIVQDRPRRGSRSSGALPPTAPAPPSYEDMAAV